MRLLLSLMFFSIIYVATAKNNVKTLTESMGQEVIEIGTPIKELPMGLEEEPAADNEDDNKQKMTSHTVQPATKKEFKKTTTADSRKKMKDVEKIDGINQDDEEARIEKELAEIYKDTADYKSDSAEEKALVQEPPNDLRSDDSGSSEELDKPIGRQRNNFKFQPDSTEKADIERFRTSVDEISCNNRQKLSGTVAPEKIPSNRAFDTVHSGLALISLMLCYIFMCN